MTVHVAFGRHGLELQLPEGFRYRMLEARSANPVPEPEKALERAVLEPIGCPPLAELARGKRSAAISVCDITRPAPNRQTLPVILRQLANAGIPRENITILIATGLHRAATAAEIRQICGEEIAAAYSVGNHHARELSEHCHLGETASGTPVYIDNRFVSADLRITLGFIEPHLMLGYSGGRKLIAPGLAAQETIKVLHSSKFMQDRRATEGSIGDNPLHRELLEIARMARHDFVLDVALARDRSIAGVFAGDPERAHRAGVEFVSRVMLETIEEPVDAVITTGAGYPLDLTFYQSVKGITAASHILKTGGRMLLIGACEEGSGAAEFSGMLKSGLNEAEFLRSLEGKPVTVDQWQLEKMALATMAKHIVYFVPGLPEEYHPSLWGRSCPSISAALDALFSGLPAGARIAVIPEGPYVLAKVAQSARGLHKGRVDYA